MTHDYLKVVDAMDNTRLVDDSIDENALYQQTTSILKLAKYAILYMVSAVNIAESRKEKTGKVLPISYEKSEGK